MDEMSVIDYEITVEYTDENLNRSAAVGRLLPGTDNRMLAKVMSGGGTFADWHSWVPADATSYSLNSGANLHALYEFLLNFAKENIPESHEALEKFEVWQDEFDLHIDEDILQAFSGETISVTLPAETPTPMSSEQTFMAMKCSKPDRIRELLHRAIGHLQEIPAVKMQQLKLTESESLEGFEELSRDDVRHVGCPSRDWVSRWLDDLRIECRSRAKGARHASGRQSQHFDERGIQEDEPAGRRPGPRR